MAAACCVVAVSCVNEDDIIQTSTSQSNSAYADYEYVPNEVVVKFKASVRSSAGREVSLLSVAEAEILETVYEPAGKSAAGRVGDDGKVVLVSSKLGTLEAIARLKKLPEVEYAEPNFIYQHFVESNDTYYVNGSLWGMYGHMSSPASPYGSQAAEAWADGHTDASNVWIGVIDEGYMYTHEDLHANAARNPGESEANGVDDDGNGYVDDVYGWDFDGNNNSVFDGVDDDHGTHVAGTIGAVGGNGKGVAGVVWSVKMMNAKFLGKRGGTTSNAIKAVDYFTNLKKAGMNFVATSNSWGGGGFSQALKDAIERANTEGILFIAAAGNASNDNDNNDDHYPSSYSNANIISVASITKTGELSSFSNYGATTVDLGAPGSSIVSTVPKRSKGSGVSGYASYSGTSMATPHVTGAAALYAATYPDASAAQIKAAILESAMDTDWLRGKCVSNGQLDVAKLITTPPAADVTIAGN